MTSTTNLTQLTAAAYKGFSEGNLEPLLAMLHPEVKYVYHNEGNSPLAGEYLGVSGVSEFFGHLPNVDMEKFEVTGMREKDNKVVVLVDIKITPHATSLTREGQEVHVLDFDGDKLMKMDLYPPVNF